MKIDYGQPNVASLFSVTYQYRVPPYQRGYAWKEGQVDAFWTDLSGMGSGAHFLGPMVLHDPGEGDIREIIDGQQRLTTLQVLIALIRDRYVALGDPDRDPSAGGEPTSTAPQSLIWNGVLEKRFVLQAGDHNRDVLENCILRGPKDKLRRRPDGREPVAGLSEIPVQKLKPAIRARNKMLLDAWVRLDGHLSTYLKSTDDPIDALKRLEESVYKRVTVVSLDLKDLDDAFLLFETLNDRGLRLSAADLLKSHLLSRFEQKHKGDSKALENASLTWDQVVDGLGGGDISAFLRHYLLLSHPRVRKDQVFPLFKKLVKEAGPDKTLTELRVSGELYSDFLRPKLADPQITQVLEDLRDTSIDTHRIALLAARRWITDLRRFSRFARVAECLSFRWVVTGGNAQVLESIYQEAAAKIKASDGTLIDEAEADLEAKFPNDEAFRDGFIGQELGYQYQAAYALRKIEGALFPFAAKVFKGEGKVHLEHIMPQKETDFWAERMAPDAAYEDEVQRWGNLTLLLGVSNSAISNGDWATKSEGTGQVPGYKLAGGELTKDLATLADWTSTDIDLRSKWLAVLAPRVWSVKGDVTGLPMAYAEVKASPALLDPFL